MNLLFVTTHLPPDNHFGGVVQSGQALLSAFKHLLPNVKACCVSRDPENLVLSNPLTPICCKTRLMHRWGFAPGLVGMLNSMIMEADIVVVNGIMTYPMTIAGAICNRTGKPYVVSPRGGLLTNAMALKSGRKQLFYRLFIRSILAGASAIHVTSEAEHECVRTLRLKTPVVVVPNGANLPPDNCRAAEHLPAQICSLPPDAKMVLFLGRIAPIKGVDLLLKVWADIIKEKNYTNATLVIAGPSRRRYLRKLRKITQKLDIENKVISLGMVDETIKWTLYQRADIFILPSYSENFGLVVTEALACSTPVIATTTTPWEDLNLWNAGRWVPPERHKLAVALCQLLDMDNEQLTAMGKCGQKLVQQNYCWDIIARKLITVYRCIIGGRDTPVYPDIANI